MSSAHVNDLAGAPPSGNGAAPHTPSGEASFDTASASRRPEVAVGVAFAGGLLLALLLRRVRS